MYSVLLIVSMVVVVLSPLLIDLLLTLQEAQAKPSETKEGPHYAWASPRVQ